MNDPSQKTWIDFIANNWGSLASVLGLFLSALAALFARRASAAASEARDIVFALNLAEDINVAQKLAADIVGLVETSKFDVARVRCNDLHDRTVAILNRWSRNLNVGSRNNCLTAQSLMESIRTTMDRHAARNIPFSPKQSLDVLDACRKVRTIFVEEHATALKRSEEELHA